MLKINNLVGMGSLLTSAPPTIFHAVITSPTSYVLGSGWNGYTMVLKYPTSVFSGAFGSFIKLTLIGAPSSSTGSSFNNVTISQVATSGNAYDSLTTPTAITFSGSASGTIGTNLSITSDEIAFAPVTSTAVLIAINVGSLGDVAKTNYSAATTYYHSALQEAATTARTAGYSPLGGFSYWIVKLEAA